MPRYTLQKTFEISGSHTLNLPYDSKCSKLHGHNWRITVYCSATPLEVEDNNGMVVDFTAIKDLIQTPLDHAHLNNVFTFNPTAENIAQWVCSKVPHCDRVDVQESAGNVVSYVRED